MKRRTLFSIVCALILGVIISSTYFLRSVSASDLNSVAEKWLYNAYYSCLNSSALNRSIDRDWHRDGKKVAKTIFPGGGSFELPSLGYFSRLGDKDSISCKETLLGAKSSTLGKLAISGVLRVAESDITDNDGDISFGDLAASDSLLQKVGYEVDQGSDEAGEFTIVATVTTINETTNSETTTTESSDKIKVTRDANGQLTYKDDGLTNAENIVKIKIDNGQNLTIQLHRRGRSLIARGLNWLTGSENGCDELEWSSRPIPLSATDLNSTLNSIKSELANARANYKCTSLNHAAGGGYETTNYIYTFSMENAVSYAGGSKYVYPSDTEAAAKKSLTNFGSSFANLTLNEDEKYDLFYYYLSKTIGDADSFEDLTNCENDSSGDYTQVNLKSGGKWRKFYIDLRNIDLGGSFSLAEAGQIQHLSLQDIISWMNSHDAEDIEEDEECNDITPITSNSIDNTLTEEDIDTDEANCFNSAGALGWIICPILTAVSGAVNGAYDLIVDPFLEVKISMFDTNDSGQTTYRAWQTFQGIANILFIVAFLIVIFSQLTGVGIDNYGIKRILPQLIVAAVLINMSYIICTLFIDISNILGTALHEFFNNISVAATGTTVGTKVGGALMSALVSVGLGYLAIQTAALWVPVILPSLFLALITMLISIVFVFILLGVRQAGILILTVISPLAFACYMLPNTKPFFDRWRKLLQGLLMVYPICGVLIGGGAFAGKVLLAAAGSGTSGAGFGTTLIAMLLSVVPFFFIPTILRSSMNAMGNIGARISNFGSNLGRTASNAAGNSQAMKDFRTRLNAGVDRNGNLTALGRSRDNIAKGRSIFSRIPGMQRAASRSAAQGRAAYLKDRSVQKNEARLNDPQYMAAQIARQDAEQLSDEIKTQQTLFESNGAYIEGDWDKLSEKDGLIEQVLDRGDKTEITGMVNAMSRDDHTRNALEEVLKRKTEAGAAGSLVKADGSAVSTEAADTIRNTKLAMTQNAGAWKAGDRQGDMWSTKGSLDFNDYDYGKSDDLANKLSANYMINSDDQAIDSIAAAMSSGSISDATKEKYQSYAYEALHSDGAENMKEERKVQLEKIAGNYRPPEVLKVEHDQSVQYDEDSALRRGRTSQTFSYRDQNTGTTINTTEQLYAVPDSFHSSIAAGQTQHAGYSKASNGDTIYTRKVVESSTGKVVSTQKWNATTGKYMS